MLFLPLEEIKVIGCSECYDRLRRVPGRVKDLFVEVQTVDADLVLLALAARADAPRLERLLRLEVLAARLERHVTLCLSVEDPEEIVV